MSKKSSVIARRAWNLLRLALVWARKGGLFRNKLAMSLNLLHKVIRQIIDSNESRRALAYGDHEFSFSDTPIIHVKMHRPSSSLRFKMPRIPCINPHVDFEYDEEDVMSDDKMWYGEYDSAQSMCSLEEEEEEEMNGDEEIDLKAEEFIAKFYEQMKQQRQISYLQYNDTVESGSGR